MAAAPAKLALPVIPTHSMFGGLLFHHARKADRSAGLLLFTGPAESSLIVQLVRKEYDKTLSDSNSWRGKMYLL